MSLPSLSLDAFQACASVGNFTRAAEKLHITQSALSQRIKNLEDELATSLFIRDRSGVRLTEQGEELLRYCQARESIEQETVDRIKGASQTELTGVIRIGAFSSVARSAVLPALAPLLKDNTNLKIEFISRELFSLPDLLRTGEIDFAVLDQTLSREGLVTHHLADEINVLVQHRGFDGPEVFLDHDEKDQTTFKYLRLRSSEKIAKVERRYLDDVYGIIDGVKLGLGIAVLPLHLIKKEKELIIVDRHELKIPIVLHYFERPFYSKLHQNVVATLKARIPKLLS